MFSTRPQLTINSKVPAPSGTALVRELDFTPMDAFMSHVLESFKLDAELAVKVFPPGARIVHAFADRVAMDVIGEYISTLLGQTRIMSPEMSLRATAASFVQAWKLVDAAVELLGEQQTETPRTMIEHSVYQMFEPHMDEYLDDETEWVQGALDGICNAWDAQLNDTAREAGVTPTSAVATPAPRAGANSGPQFLTSQNPDQVKRNVLASFRDILLIPVTIVPRTVTFGVNAIVSGSTHAVSGLAMLNPQKWVGNNQVAEKGQRGHMVNGEVVFDQNVVATPDDYDEKRSVVNAEDGKDDVDNLGDAVDRLGVPDRLAVPSTPGTPLTPGAGPSPTTMAAFDRLQLLVSIDTALELIHGDREALKRAETFAKYPGKSGTKVYEAIEEVFILLLKAVGDRHIAPGFRV
jgi:recyclin-1